MTQTPEGARVAELEQRLAEAAAEVARVQAELSSARAADPAHPQVPVPYDGQAPVVMINGQQVPAGQSVDVSAMLGSMFGGTPAAAVHIPPVVTVNGQVVSGGQPVDLSAVIGPEALAQVRSSLEQLGLGGVLGGVMGAVAAPPAAGPGPALAHTAGSGATTPGEVSDSGNRVLLWAAAVLVLGLVGVLVYLGVTG